MLKICVNSVYKSLDIIYTIMLWHGFDSLGMKKEEHCPNSQREWQTVSVSSSNL